MLSLILFKSWKNCVFGYACYKLSDDTLLILVRFPVNSYLSLCSYGSMVKLSINIFKFSIVLTIGRFEKRPILTQLKTFAFEV